AGQMNPGIGSFALTVINQADAPRSVRAFKTASDAQFARLLEYVDRVGRPIYPKGAVNGNIQPYMEFGWGIDMTLDPNDASTLSGWLDPGTYGIRCMPERRGMGDVSDGGWRRSDFVGPIDVR